MPDPEAYVSYFNLDEGKTVPQTIQAGSLLATQFDTYFGREEITIAGNPVKTCRIDTEIILADDDPQYKRSLIMSRWYGVGTGLLLKRNRVVSPDASDVTIIEETVNAAEINGNKIF